MTADISSLVWEGVKAALDALHRSQVPDQRINSLNSLLIVREELAQVYEDRAETPVTRRQVVNGMLEQALRRLEGDDAEAARLLKKHYWQGHSRARIKRDHDLEESASTVRRRWEAAALKLAELIYQAEMDRRKDRCQAIEGTLPDYRGGRFFGRETDLQILTDYLLNPNEYYVVAVVGLSGLGKTRLAQELVRSLIPRWHFLDIIWLDGLNLASPNFAPQALLPALARHFKLDWVARTEQWGELQRILHAAPYLIVIDDVPLGIEAMAWLSDLRGLANPSKFLVTSRTQPPPGQGVFTYSLSRLERSTAFELLCYLAAANGPTDFAQATELEIARFYQAVDGNPQQIRMAAQLAYTTSLATLLEHLPVEGDNIGMAVYDQAWMLLPDISRQLLQAFRLAATSGTSDQHLRAVAGLSESDFWRGLFALRMLCLVDQHPQGLRFFYQIHASTERYVAQHEQDDVTGNESPFEQMVLTNCAYWRKILAADDVAQLEKQQSHLLKGVLFAIDCPPAWSAAVELLLHLYPAVEKSIYWRAWLPIFEAALANGEVTATLPTYRLLTCTAALNRRAHQLDRALERYEQAREMGRSLQRPTSIAKAYLNLSIVYRLKEQFADAQEHAQIALDIFQKNGAGDEYLAPAYNTLGLTAFRRALFTDACGHYETAIAFYEARADNSGLARAYNNLGNCLHEMGNLTTAKYALEKALFHAQKVSFDLELVMLSLAAFHISQAEWEQAEYFCRSVRIQPGESAPAHEALLDRYWGCFHAGQGEFTPAFSHLERSLTLWESLGDHQAIVETWCILGQACEACGKREQSQAYFDKATAQIVSRPQDRFLRHLEGKYRLRSRTRDCN